MRSVMKIAAVAALGSLALTGCGSKPSSGGSSGGSAAPVAKATGKKVSACMVLDTGGVDDRSFNQDSWAGMQAAKKTNPSVSVKYVPSNSGAEYTPNLTKLATGGCDTIIGVGGLMADNVKAAAKSYPKVHFAEVDAPGTGANFYGIQYNTAQAGFLGGYVAASLSKSGTVGTWGGLPIPPVTIYMDGFWEGVQYFNKTKSKSVKVLGWNEMTKTGTFSNSFTDQGKGKSVTQQMASQGADVVFPVAGGSGLGAGAAAQAAGGKLKIMWVDTNGCESAAQYCKYMVGSVTKNLSGGVQTYLAKSAEGTYPTGNYIGTLANSGVSVVDNNDSQSAALKGELAKIKTDIGFGTIKITSPSQPKS